MPSERAEPGRGALAARSVRNALSGIRTAGHTGTRIAVSLESPVVRISIDSSGAFDVTRTSPGDPGVAAAVIVPDRHRDAVEDEVRDRAANLGLPELHAVELASDEHGREQLVDI